MPSTEHFDVLIVGVGISGIGAAYHLQQQCPSKRFVMLEAMAGHGGTWRTHRYPGTIHTAFPCDIGSHCLNRPEFPCRDF